MKKKFIKKSSMILFLLMIFSTIILGDTIYASEVSIQNHVEYSNDSIEPFNEKARWYYRTVDGRQQKRLWSLTTGTWLTNWEWV